MASHPLAQATRDWNAALGSGNTRSRGIVLHMFNSQTCLNNQPVAIGAYFGLKSWHQNDTARVIITSARFACVTGALKHQHGILRGDVGAS